MVSPFMNTAELANWLRYVDAKGSLLPDARKRAREWAYRHLEARRLRHRGSDLLVHRDDVDAALMRRTA